ncbi:hypothetical protein TNCT6_04410 [Streptomyces sp. 6-11-2]|nr:hypothetical protein TNCT6_04410 [Streptomyces sp. 6-11-2]
MGAGSGGLFIADTTQQAVTRFKDYYEARVRQTHKPHLEGRPGYNTPFHTIEDAVADGPHLIGSPQQITDKILGFHAAYRHDLQSITVDTSGLSLPEQIDQLRRFAEEIAPVVRREAPCGRRPNPSRRPNPPATERSPPMATVLSVSGSPSATSRTAKLLRHLDHRLAAQGHDVIPLDVRTLPADALLGADFRHPAIGDAAALFERADGVVIGTPIYKAAYSGLLKSLLDLLPQYALTGKTVLPLATGGSTAHVLAIDYALRPVLNSMGAAHIVPGWFTLDRDINVGDDGTLTVAPGSAEALAQVTDQFSVALGGRATVLAATA